MVRDARVARRWLDLVSACGRLAAGFLLVLVPYLCAPAARASSNASYDSAMSSCEAYLSAHWMAMEGGDGDWETPSCVDGSGAYAQDVVAVAQPNAQGVANHVSAFTTSNPFVAFPYSGSPPVSNPCTSLPSTSGPIEFPTSDAPLTNGMTTTQNATDPTTGTTVQCVMTWAATSPCTQAQTPEGPQWSCDGKLTPTGNPANASSGQQVGTWSNSDGSAPASPPPTTATAAQGTTATSICGGGSCYDPTTDSYCATVGGSQFCVPGSNARSAAGGCQGGGVGAVCAGSPTAPLPNPSQVPDPATQIQSTDKTVQADPTTGAQQQVTTNVYTSPGVKATSGQQAGDQSTQPAPASSTSNASSYGGGSDCNTPPVCSGDAATCGAARQQWYAMCTNHKDQQALYKALVGDGSAPSPSSSAPTAASVWSDGTSTGDATADNANQGNYDSSGFGFDTSCPMQDIAIPLWDGKTFTLQLSKGCVVGPWLHAAILAFAVFWAARITAGAH